MSWRENRILLVGQAPSASMKRGDRPLIGGKSGFFLQQLCGMTLRQYVKTFETLNLLSEYPGKDGKGDRFPMKEARISAALYATGWSGRRVIFMGKNVARAFGKDKMPPMEWVSDERGFRYAIMPHPSGVNRWWNSKANMATAKAFLEKLKETK